MTETRETEILVPSTAMAQPMATATPFSDEKDKTGFQEIDRIEEGSTSSSKQEKKDLLSSTDMYKKTATTTTTVAPGMPRGNTSGCCGNSCRVIAVIICIIVVIVIIVSIAVATTNHTEEYDYGTPTQADFITGVSLITYYAVNATLTSRLARTVITMEVANAMDCVSVHGITLQLPADARVASLQTISTENGCITNGVVQAIATARETFLESAAKGLPGAYVEERNAFTFSVQATLPPFGTTRVELVVEQMLQPSRGRIEFAIPVIPEEAVDKLVLDLSISDVDVNPNGTDFYLLNWNASQGIVNATSAFHADFPDAREHNLPRLLRGYYQPTTLPDEGRLFTDGTCFEHYFHPTTSLTSMAKNVFFLMDVSDPMCWGDNNDETNKFPKLQAAKTALNRLIDTLGEDDTLTIQTFASQGTESMWGLAQATPTEKADAKQFVDQLKCDTNYGGTNLHAAYLEGLLRAKRQAVLTEKSNDKGHVTLLILVSAGQPSSGETRRGKMIQDVWKLNHQEEGEVKIFSLGFPDSDMQLLNAIAAMNGGLSAPIIAMQSGTDNNNNAADTEDFVTQMDRFFQGQFGNVLLSDVSIEISSGETDGVVVGATQRIFPVLADGSEIVVRGLVPANGTTTVNNLQAVTRALTQAGVEQTWTATAVANPLDSSSSGNVAHSLCFQSYAHARITQLLNWRDAARYLGEDDKVLLEPMQVLQLDAKPCNASIPRIADCLEQEALALAMEANLVVQGLTAMVTVDDAKCLPSFENETEVCIDGTTKDSYAWGKNDGGATGASSYRSAAASPYPRVWSFVSLVTAVVMLSIGWMIDF